MPSKGSHIGIKALVLLIRVYQYVVSPWLKPSCRFPVSCSRYAVAVLVEHGVIKGLWLAVKRLLMCGPWSKE